MTPKALTASQEMNLWRKLRTHFLSFQDVLEEIIDKQAWASSGFKTFSEAWAHHMSDIVLAKELRPLVVYQMLAEGLSVDQISETVKGVGPDTAKALQRERANGVPPTAAKGKWFNKESDTTRVRGHVRKKPKAPSTIHIELGVRKLQRVRKAADALGIKPEEFAAKAIEEKLASLSSE
ncbi:hypothetical protein MycrhDRAFT_5740 [Mycolicibacterium rhodesiae JS60]|nr:hypothetical protein MycrhDRAFT_5740 [Mycolicibacterium rhodesiae JS60]